MTPVTIPLVAAVVADSLGYTVADLRSRSREADQARAIAWFVTIDLTRASYRKVAAWYGKRDHGAVHRSVVRVSSRVGRCEWTQHTVAAVKAEVRRRAG